MLLGAASEPASFALWRAVEAQHVVSTMALVDTLAEQRLLEELLEGAKPALPAGTARLHFLLATPLRYPSPFGSRFRAPNDPGVLYGADEQRTACAELGYWRWRFLLDSPALDRLDTAPQTLFRFLVRGRTLDLREPPLDARRDEWTDRVSYVRCQALGAESRAAGVEVLRYESSRDPARGGCGAVLRPDAIAHPVPVVQETWYLLVTREGARWRAGAGRGDAVGWEFSGDEWGRT